MKHLADVEAPVSYIVAYVQFEQDENSLDYPVNCLRTDIKRGDTVVVRMESKGGKLQAARVTRVEYLNWNCVNTLQCLASEARRRPYGIKVLPGSPTVRGWARPWDVCAELRRTGWIPRKPNSKAYKIAYSHVNATQTAHIFFRSNGIDIQLVGSGGDPPLPFSRVGLSSCDGPQVRHFLSQSGINLLELTLKFAEAFKKDRDDYSEFFRPVGKSSRVTADMRHRIGKGGMGFVRDDPDRGFDAKLYGLLGGDGIGNVYVGDGLSISSSGRWISD